MLQLSDDRGEVIGLPPIEAGEETLWISLLDLEQVVGAIVDTEFRLQGFTPSYAERFRSALGCPPRIGDDARLFEVETSSSMKWSMRWTRARAGDTLLGVDEVIETDREIRHWRTQFRPIRDAHGAVMGVTMSARDVTREVLDLRRLAATRAELRHARRNETAGKLATAIAHDFNNMLAVIGGSLELIDREVQGREGRSLKRHVARGREAAARAAMIARRLLLLGRSHPDSPSRVDVQDVLAGMVDLVQAAVPDSILVEWQIDPGLWPVRAVAIDLENALLNLVLNARDAMPRGGELVVRAANYREQPGAPEYLMISIADTGCGMCPETMKRAFQPYFTTKAATKGSGMGLAGVAEFVRGVGGHVSVESMERVGTIFRLLVPRDLD